MAQPNIRIDIASTFKDKGFKQAARASTGLEAQFKRLARTFVGVFSVQQIVRFGRESVRAFAQAQQEAAQLTTQLKSLNLEFASPFLTKYFDNLALATGRSGQELTSAFVSLSQATDDVTTAQKLLRTAMDISAATGLDLSRVSQALQRAYKGETTAIARLRIGLTTAELKGKDFAEVMQILNAEFSGAQAAKADTYAVKMQRLAEAVEQAQEAFGKAFVDGIEQSDASLEDLQRTIISIGNAMGTVTGKLISFASSANKYIQLLLPPAQLLASIMDRMGGTGDSRRAAEVQGRAALRQQAAISRAEKKVQAERKKTTDLEKKAEREKQALRRAGTVFDMENIQVVAALQGRINEEQRLRLTALLALNTGNAEAAEKLSRAVLALNAASFEALGVTMKSTDTVDTLIQKVVQAQARLFLINTGISTIPKAKNPFEDWPDIMAKILADLDKITEKINNVGKVTAPGSSTTTTTTGSGATTTTVKPLQPYSPTGNVIGEGNPTILTPSGQMITATPPTFTAGGATIISGYGAMSPTARPDDTALEAAARQRISDIFATIRDFGAGGFAAPTNVTVNIGGSVLTEQDLTAGILDGLYQYQKSGRQVTYSAVAI